MRADFALEIKTEVDADSLRERLRRFEPWGHLISFSNGVSTEEFDQRRPFNAHPVRKAALALDALGPDLRPGARLLDIGCNSGHNSIAAGLRYGLDVDGIDVVDRHIEVASLLSSLAGLEANYQLASAEEFQNDDAYDVIFHFGTLYHLPNPIRSLQMTFDNLKPGGWLALETQIYRGADKRECYFMRMMNDDPTNFWALSDHVLLEVMEMIGFRDVHELSRVSPPSLPDSMFRVDLIARKPK